MHLFPCYSGGMGEQQLAFHVEEFDRISCRCEKCGMVILFDISTSDQYGLSDVCPTCGLLCPS